jgi:hypothetical protein
MHQSYEKSVKRICAQLRDESDFRLQTTQITEWLFAAVMSPVKHPGGIQAQRALAARGKRTRSSECDETQLAAHVLVTNWP